MVGSGYVVGGTGLCGSFASTIAPLLVPQVESNGAAALAALEGPTVGESVCPVP